MKTSFTLFPLASYKNKYFGIAISIIGILFSIISSLGVKIAFIEELSNGNSNSFYLLILIFGLYIMAFSKEKLEDERVKKIRSKALTVAMGVQLATLFAFVFTSITVDPEIVLDVSATITLLLITLIVYHLIFHISLFFDPSWVYTDESAIENIKKHKKFFIIYLIVLIITLTLPFFFK
jgi:small-conductance mechanosensitive channel